MRTHSSYKAAFALIEISLVLITVMLLVGGVFIGRDMMGAARIRAQISQIEAFNTAVHAFKTRYSFLPGDLPAAQAQKYGFVTRNATPVSRLGNGINFCNGTNFATLLAFGCEVSTFWNDLFVANLITQDFSANTDSATLVIAAGQANKYLPNAKILDNVSMTVFSTGTDCCAASGYSTIPLECSNDFCYSLIGGVSTYLNIPGTYQLYDASAAVTPQQAFSMDAKMDDGVPNSGSVQGSNLTKTTTPRYTYINTGAFAGSSGPSNSQLVTGNCLASPSTGNYIYNIADSSKANRPLCVMNIVHR